MTLPTGDVAFLFSDIEASTRRWERYGDAMRDALRRHDAILRAEIEARRGYVFKTIGDAFCAAFPTAGEALEAAVEAQRRLGLEDFGAIEGLHVRMAIHAGETDERSGDYFGVAANRTARLLSAGHGGQILLSGLTADRALPNLPDGVELRHLGAIPLRDVKEPERVYQPVGPGLRSEFKPLRALETPPNNLPRQRTSFVGRQEDLARVDALLDESASVTISGAGGIGKTRLALEIAASLLNDERDGAWFVDLSSIANAELIAGTILSALGAEQPAGVEPLGALLAYLEKRELLLVLDNSEHLVSGVALIVAQIVERCEQVSVLATSREPLDITGERVHRLSSLDPSSAVQLFADRARAVNPDFRLDKKMRVAEEICRRLDGIALAIELAAARVRTMSVESLSDHLELRILAGGRDRRPRQQTMRALIDWSYDLLPEAERRVLRQCAVFVRGFTLQVAKDVCAASEAEVLDLLASLVDKSLVVIESAEQGGRYRLLEPIREYASAKLVEAGELPETMRRHAMVFASFARAAYEEWDKGPAVDWRVRVERELPNCRVALRWAFDEGNDRELGARLVADTAIVFLRLSLLAEGIDCCERILDAGLSLEPAVEARLRYGLSMLYSNAGRNQLILGQALQAITLYRRTNDDFGLARALARVAASYAYEQRYDEAAAAAEEALALARDRGEPRLLADTLRRCAGAFDGKDRVQAFFAESVALFRTLGRDDETARAQEWWGQWEADVGDFHAAAEHMLEASRLDSGDDVSLYHASNIAAYYLAMGDSARAEPFARDALSLAAKARHGILRATAISYMAVIAAAKDERKAAVLVGHAEEQLRSLEGQWVPYERVFMEELLGLLTRKLTDTELTALRASGAAHTPEQAVSLALSF